ncbi:MAG: hypothetical protein JRI84_11025 [Deltaproteobacteria bacterium]|nr:hypothetical protein [Deltaproteobacteria bacterium]
MQGTNRMLAGFWFKLSRMACRMLQLRRELFLEALHGGAIEGLPAWSLEGLPAWSMEGLRAYK